MLENISISYIVIFDIVIAIILFVMVLIALYQNEVNKELSDSPNKTELPLPTLAVPEQAQTGSENINPINLGAEW